MLTRDQVKINETWNLDDLYKNEDDFYNDQKKVIELKDEFVKKHHDFKTKDQLKQAILDYENIWSIVDRLYTFAGISTEVDATNEHNQKRDKKLAQNMSKILSDISYFDSELLKTDDDVLKEFVEENPIYEYFIKRLLNKKEHMLSEENENLISKLEPAIGANYSLYNDMKYGDIRFSNFTIKDKEIEMSYNTFEEYEEYERDTDRRRKAFEHFSETIRKYQNTNASIYNNHVQTEKIISELRGYDSVFSYLLDEQDISREIYENHLDIIMEKLSDPMRKFANILKKVHKLDQMTYADLKLSVDEDFEPEVSFNESRDLIVEGLSVLGDEYTDILKEAFDNRWIDYAQNIGKRTGAFCSSPYLSHPYIMTTYNNRMSQVMTLAHELGHAGHFKYANENQPYLNVNVSRYFVEAPSTANEITMERFLLKNAKDDRERLWILSTMISKTYYHNFVTHFIEASFQREVYRRVDEGENLTASDLNEIFNEKLKEFWKDDVVLSKGSELTWMRQPHYYMGLYPYTYSAGLSIGTIVSEKIVHGTKEDAKNWIEVLKSGAKKSPVELAKMAGVDMTSTKPIEDTIDFISKIIDEIDILCEKTGLYK
ncbi:MAG: oligoendopeptidase F [Tissierellia bacterium]|nr:oligoendopeptidase F [Tissierellia bacterium]